MTRTTFTKRETAFLAELAALGGWHVDVYGEVRRTERSHDTEVGVCPLCAYANAKAGTFLSWGAYWERTVEDQYPDWLRGNGRAYARITCAADFPDNPRRPELLRLLGVRQDASEAGVG